MLEIELVRFHRDYVYPVYRDIALVKLREDFDFENPGVKKIQMYSIGAEEIKEKMNFLTILGWGSTDRVSRTLSFFFEC